MAGNSQGNLPHSGRRRCAGEYHLGEHRLSGPDPSGSGDARLVVRYFTAQDRDDLDRALLEIAEMAPDGLIVESDAGLISERGKILAFAAERRLPTVYGNLDYIPDGGLMAYFTDIFDTWRRLARYVDRVLKRAKPAD